MPTQQQAVARCGGRGRGASAACDHFVLRCDFFVVAAATAVVEILSLCKGIALTRCSLLDILRNELLLQIFTVGTDKLTNIEGRVKIAYDRIGFYPPTCESLLRSIDRLERKWSSSYPERILCLLDASSLIPSGRFCGNQSSEEA
jgi:hypothetical protein